MDLSVIVTCFNKIEFIPRFLENAEIILQFGCELVVVDDASEDGSSSLLSDFAQNHTEMKLFLMQLNQGSAEARNVGLNNATRSFVFFLDIDDTCDVPELCDLFRELSTSNCDLAVANALIEPGDNLLQMPFETHESLSTSINSVSSSICRTMGYSRYVYKRTYIARNSIRFFPNRNETKGHYFILDDAFWLILISASSGTILVSPPHRIVYNYNPPESTSNSWKIYLYQIMQLPVLVLNFLQEFNKNTELNSRILQENTFDWLCQSLRILAVNEVFATGFFSLQYQLSLRKETSQGLNFLEYCLGIFQAALFSVKNSISMRKRLRALLHRH
jgi:glycosyltransferase involved in cell wall biosynthesis